MTLTFEDFPVGRLGSYGPHHVTREEILAFAAEYDPQLMHLDEEAASKSMLKGLQFFQSVRRSRHDCCPAITCFFEAITFATAGSPVLQRSRSLG